MLLGEQLILSQERLKLPSGSTTSCTRSCTASLSQSIWVSFTAANIVPLRASTMREKSLERRTLLSRSFHLSGRLRAAFAGVRCWPATTADRRLASTSTAMWLPGGNHSSASDINDLDEVAGTSGSAAGERAVLWTTNGNIRDLGTLPGDTSSEASAINNNGDVVGYSKGPRGMRAFLWTQATGMQDLGVLSGGNSSRALGINDMGAVVGSSTSSSGDRAFIWTKQEGMRDLNSAASVASGAVFFEAHAINNTGQILVMGSAMHGSHGSGEAAEQCAPAPPSSYLLTPARTVSSN